MSVLDSERELVMCPAVQVDRYMDMVMCPTVQVDRYMDMVMCPTAVEVYTEWYTSCRTQ